MSHVVPVLKVLLDNGRLSVDDGHCQGRQPGAGRQRQQFSSLKSCTYSDFRRSESFGWNRWNEVGGFYKLVTKMEETKTVEGGRFNEERKRVIMAL